MSNQNKVLSLKATKAPSKKAHIVASIDDRELFVDTCDLWSDADKDRVADAIHRACPAIELLEIQRRLLMIDRDNLPVGESVPKSAAAWDDPIDVERPELPPFPSHCLPDGLRAWVESAAEAYQVPKDLPGLLALAACSGMVARRFEVTPSQGWIEPVNLYVCCLLDPANRKSAAFRAAFEPVREIEKRLIESAGPDVARLQSERRIDEKRLAELEKKASKPNGDLEASQEAAELSIRLAETPIPALPRLIMDDATAEAVEIALTSQGGRLIVSGCEGGLFDVMAGRYSGGASNLDVFLKAHAGDDLRVDRVTRGAVFVERCCLTLAYAVQPQVIQGLADNRAFRGRGLIGRFLYSFPGNILGRRRIDSRPIPPDVADSYGRLIDQLFSHGENVGMYPKRLTLSPGASICFRSWQLEVESWLGDAGRLADLRDWGGKLCGLTARLAGVFHLIDHAEGLDPSGVPIERESVESAIELSRWAVDHAEAVVSLMGADCEPLGDAAYVLRWLRARGLPDVTRRDIHSHGRSRFDGEPDRLDRCLVALSERGWIRGIDSAESGPGRPSVGFEINPRVFAVKVPTIPRPSEPPAITGSVGGRVRGTI
jgi:hypothetical protein